MRLSSDAACFINGKVNSAEPAEVLRHNSQVDQLWLMLLHGRSSPPEKQVPAGAVAVVGIAELSHWAALAVTDVVAPVERSSQVSVTQAKRLSPK